MASVTFTNVEKRYGDVPVIDRSNLEVRDREFMVLVGPSGSGKSMAPTTLKARRARRRWIG